MMSGIFEIPIGSIFTWALSALSAMFGFLTHSVFKRIGNLEDEQKKLVPQIVKIGEDVTIILGCCRNCVLFSLARRPGDGSEITVI